MTMRGPAGLRATTDDVGKSVRGGFWLVYEKTDFFFCGIVDT
jgi:hypothetical protein